MQRVPITLLTGFLGSGKTTLLARLLKTPELADTAVIVNEFGEIGLDHLLLERGGEEVLLLDSGCLCCAVGSELAETLTDLHFRRLRKEIPAFSRVVIETSGLADPAPILGLLLADPAIAKRYALDAVVTTVDLRLGEQQLDTHPEALKQVAVADVLVLTKADAATATQAVRLDTRLATVNANARRIRSVRGDVDAALLFRRGAPDAVSDPEHAAMLAGIAPASKLDGHRHLTDIGSFTVAFERPITWAAYAAWLERLRQLPAAGLLRVKGIVALGDNGGPHVVQGVQHVFGVPLPLDCWPAGYSTSRLTFITRGLVRADVLEGLTDDAQALAVVP